MIGIEHSKNGARRSGQPFGIHRIHVESVGATGLHQPGSHEGAEVMAHQWLGQALGLDQFAYAALALAQRFEEPEPSRVGQRPQDGEGVLPINGD